MKRWSRQTVCKRAQAPNLRSNASDDYLSSLRLKREIAHLNASRTGSRNEEAPNQRKGASFFPLRQLWHRRSRKFHFCKCSGSLVFLGGEYINMVIKALLHPDFFGIFFIPPKTSKVYRLFFAQTKPLASFFLPDFFGEVIGEDFLIAFWRLRFWSAVIAPFVAFLVMGFRVALPAKQEHILSFCLPTLRKRDYVVPL